MIVLGLGLGTSLAPSITAATAGVAAEDAGVGSAMVNTSQQIGGAVGAAALSAVFANAVTQYVAGHHPSSPRAAGAVQAAAAIHGYSAAFTVSAFIFLGGAIVLPLIFRSGRLTPTRDVPVGV
jgi:hypothetical protein